MRYVMSRIAHPSIVSRRSLTFSPTSDGTMIISPRSLCGRGPHSPEHGKLYQPLTRAVHPRLTGEPRRGEKIHLVAWLGAVRPGQNAGGVVEPRRVHAWAYGEHGELRPSRRQELAEPLEMVLF